MKLKYGQMLKLLRIKTKDWYMSSFINRRIHQVTINCEIQLTRLRQNMQLSVLKPCSDLQDTFFRRLTIFLFVSLLFFNEKTHAQIKDSLKTAYLPDAAEEYWP